VIYKEESTMIISIVSLIRNRVDEPIAEASFETLVTNFENQGEYDG